MDTRGSIEFLEKKNIPGNEFFKMKIKNIKKLAKMLQQGEADNKELKIVKEELKKYRQMWEELREGKYKLIEFDNEGYEKGIKDFIDFEQKYFPEKMNQNEKTIS
jgi:hypothetical protein